MDFKYSIENINPEPQDIDDEIVFFNFDICYTAPTEETISGFVTFDTLKLYIKRAQPKLYEYIENTKDSLDLWGPAEASTIEALGEEALTQLHEHLLDYLKEINYAEDHYEWWQNLQKSDIGASEQSLVDDLSPMIAASRYEEKRYRNFCQKTERAIREIAMEVYPEITDLEPEQLLKFKYLFVNQIMEMQERIDDLLHNRIED